MFVYLLSSPSPGHIAIANGTFLNFSFDWYCWEEWGKIKVDQQREQKMLVLDLCLELERLT